MRAKTQDFVTQLAIEPGHHANHDDEDSHAQHHAHRRDQRDHRDECALRTQITEGQKKLEGQTGHEQVGQAGAVLCSLKRVMAHAAP
jgi:hypothetical protein